MQKVSCRLQPVNPRVADMIQHVLGCTFIRDMCYGCHFVETGPLELREKVEPMAEVGDSCEEVRASRSTALDSTEGGGQVS